MKGGAIRNRKGSGTLDMQRTGRRHSLDGLVKLPRPRNVDSRKTQQDDYARGMMNSEQSTDSQSLFDSRSDGAGEPSDVKRKKKKRLPNLNFKKSLMGRNRHTLESSGTALSNSSIGDDESFADASPRTSPRASPRASPRTTSRLSGDGSGKRLSHFYHLGGVGGQKKKRVSTMGILKNKVLNKNRIRRSLNRNAATGKAGTRDDIEDEFESENETVHSGDEEEEDEEEDEEELEFEEGIASRHADDELEGFDLDRSRNTGSATSRKKTGASPTPAGVDVVQSRNGSPPLPRGKRMIASRRRSSVDERSSFQLGEIRRELGAPEADSAQEEPKAAESSEMQQFLQKKLEEWNVPRTKWKLPGEVGDKDNGTKSSRKDRPDPTTNYKRIKFLVENFDRAEKRREVLSQSLLKLRQATQLQLDELRKKIKDLEGSMDEFESGVSHKEKQIRETFQNYKTDLAREVRDRVNRQLESREADYYNAIGRIREQLKDMSFTAEGGVVETVVHKGLSLVINGAGTIAHLVSSGIGVMLYPLSVVKGIFTSRS